MKYSHNQICVKDGEITTGQQYDYKEEDWIALVEIVEQNPTEEWIGFTLKVLAQNYPINNEDVITVGAATGHYAYNGMWRLFDKGAYTHSLEAGP